MDALPYGTLAAIVGLVGGMLLGLAGRMGHWKQLFTAMTKFDCACGALH